MAKLRTPLEIRVICVEQLTRRLAKETGLHVKYEMRSPTRARIFLIAIQAGLHKAVSAVDARRVRLWHGNRMVFGWELDPTTERNMVTTAIRKRRRPTREAEDKS